MSQIIEYSATEAGLADIKARMKDVVYEVTTTAGMEMARKDRRELVTLRTSLEAKRKELKEPALKRCKDIDSEAARIKEQILALETPIDAVIKAEEDRKAAEKAERDRILQEKLAKVMETIERIKNLPDRSAHLTSAKIADVKNLLASEEITQEEFGNFTAIAQEHKEASLLKLGEMFHVKQAEEQAAFEAEQARIAKEEEDRIAREAEEKRLAEEREKLRIEREQFEKEQAEAKAKAEAEQTEKDALAHAENERLRKEQEALDAEKKRLEDEEKERVRLEAIENEKKRIAAEKEKKKADRQRMLAESKVSDLSEALRKIYTICHDDEFDDAEKINRIDLICEANL